MATMPRRQPRSVADPDKEAYDAAMRQEHAQRERREAEAARQQRIADTANLAGDVLAGSQAAPSAVAAASRFPENLEAARFAKRFGGPLGVLLSGVTASAGFKADRARGMPLDEALIKHAGGAVLGGAIGWVGATSGAVVGAPGGPGGSELGAAVGGYMGQEDGEHLAGQIANGWGGLKQSAQEGQQSFNRFFSTVNDPEQWIGRSRRQ